MLQILKHGRFSITSIRKPLIVLFMYVSEKSEIVATQTTKKGARPDRKARFILGELFDT